ncbi:hypothetical protein KGF57_001517 [Candida theae]|uniref:Nucleoporin POM33 n=1 Tax=Candida theae TaxID=1198502 RepID=A0AAD5BGY7_9ASCO|nr:uncharacterized protein KGF57_001517 [Candida theae]KAI5961978.1 hypothetical protein KGF57_001517 [Candida theae]
MPPKATTSSASSTTRVQSSSPAQQFVALLKTQQFYWYLGHVFAIIFFALSSLSGILFRQAASLRYYRFTLLSIIVTYLIVLKQVYLKRSGQKATTARLIGDENVQYLSLAVVFYLASFILDNQVQTVLYSYIIFAVFHALTYFQNNLLTVLIPSVATQQRVNSAINNFTTQYNQPALSAASSVEIVLAVMSAFDVLISTFWVLLKWNIVQYATKVVLLAAVVVFIKLRYEGNQFTKAAVGQLDQTANGYVNQLNSPQLTQKYFGYREKLIRSLASIQRPKVEKKTQ